MSDTSLVFNVIARDRASNVFRRIQRSAKESSSGIVLALGPALLPVLGSATAATIGLGAALVGAGAAAGVFGAVTKTAFSEVQHASQKTQDLQDKIILLGEQVKVANATGLGDAGKLADAQAKAQNELLARYALLPPATRKVVMAYDGMRMSWKKFVDANKPAVYSTMTGGFSLLSSVVPKLQPLFDVASAAAGRLVGYLTRAAGGGGIERLVAWLTSQAGPAIDNLGRIIGNLTILIGKLFQGFAGQGQGVLDWLATVTGKWAAFAQQTGSGGLQAFMDSINSNGPQVWQLLSDIATSAVHIAQAVSPLAPVSLAIASALAAILAALPPGVITALVAAWVAYSVALKGYYAYMTLVGVATKVWAGVQWLLNVAMMANPIGLVVLGIIALIAIIVLIATKTRFFQTIWAAVWGFLKKVGAWFAGPFAAFFKAGWNSIVYQATTAWNFIRTKVTGFVSWITSVPGKVSAKLASMWNGLKHGFKAAVNWVISRWNNFHLTIGGGSFLGQALPSFTLNTPDIPYMAKGGTVNRSGLAMVGERGPELLSLNRGAQVTPLSRGGGAGVGVIRLEGGDQEFLRFLRKVLRVNGM